MHTCYALDEAARAGALAVVLETVDDLVYQNTADLVCTTVCGVDDVLARKMNLLCRFRAGRIGYAIHGPKDKLYSLYAVSTVGNFLLCLWLLVATHCFGALSVVTYSHWRTATVASCMTRMGSTLSKKSLIPG